VELRQLVEHGDKVSKSCAVSAPEVPVSSLRRGGLLRT